MQDNFLNNYNKGHKPDIGNLYPEEVWLVDESLLVLKGGSTKDNEIFEDVWEPLDDYEAPYREPVLPPPDFDPDTLEIGVGVPIDQVYKFNHQMIPRPDENPYEKTTTTTTTHSPLPPVPAVPTLSFSPAPASGLQRGYPNLALVRQNEIKTVLKEQEKHRVLPTPSPHKMRSPKVSRSRGPTKAPTPTPTTESEVKPKETPKVRVSSLSPHNPSPVPQLRSYQNEVELGQDDYKAFIDEVSLFISKMENFHPERKSEQHQNGHDSVHLSGNHALQHTSGNNDEINRSVDPDRRQVWSVPVSPAEEGNYPGNAPNFGAEEPALQFPHNNNKQHHHSDTEQGFTSRVRDPLQSHIARQSIARQEQQQEQEAPVVTSSLPRRNINHIAEFRSFPSPSTPPPALKFEEEISPPTPPPPSPSFYSSTQSTEVNRDDRQTTLARSTTPSPPPATSTPVSSLPLRSQLVTSTPYISSPTTPSSSPSSPTPSPYNIVDGLGFDYADALEGFEAVKLKAGSHRGSIFGEGAKVISPIPEYDDRETATEPLIDRDHGISPFQRSVYPRSTTTPASWLPTPSSSPPSPPTPSPSPSPLPTTPSLSPIIATTFSALEYIEDNTIDNTIADSYREENDKFSKSLPDPIYSGFVPITPTSAPRFGSAAPVVSNPYPTLYPSIYPTLTAPGIGEHFDENFVLRNHEFGTKLRNDNNNYPDPSENEILEGIDRKGKSYPPLVNTNSHHSAVNSLSPLTFQGRSRRPTPPPPPPPPHPSIQRTTPPTPTHRRVSRPNNTLSRLISRRRGAVRRRRPVNNNNTNRQSKILRPRNPAPPPIPAAAQSIDRSSAGAVRYVSFFSGVTGGQTWGYSYNLGR